MNTQNAQAQEIGEDVFLPANADTADVKLPKNLQPPYRAVREAVDGVHTSVRRLWAEVYAFGIECLKDENANALKQVCDAHNVTAKANTSPFIRPTKIATGVPTWDEEKKKVLLVFNDPQITRFCRAFDYARERYKLETADQFYEWLIDRGPEGGGGTIANCVERATEWLKDGKPGSTDSSLNGAIFLARLEKAREENQKIAESLFSDEADLKALELSDGDHFSLTVSVEDGKPVVDRFFKLQEDNFRSSMRPQLPKLAAGETPKSLGQLVKALVADVKDFAQVEFTISDGKATIKGTDGEGPKVVLDNEYLVLSDVRDGSYLASIIALKEIKQCLAIFPEKTCNWKLEADSILITVPEDQTVAALFTAKKKKQKSPISLNDAFVSFLDNGNEVRAHFKRQAMGAQPQAEFEPV
ncbi:MAG: hypothetical protein ACPGOV_13445 [Magnetovibrionaceae bacterium]